MYENKIWFFVSNSSSSSFVLMLPKNFNADMYVDNMEDDWVNGVISDHNIKDKEQIKEYLNLLVNDGGIYCNDNYRAFGMCSDVLCEFVITSVDGGPDDGSITIISEAERERLKKLLYREIKYDKLTKINELNK